MKSHALLIGAALVALALPALAQDKTFNMRLSHWVPATHPLQKAMEEWGASVEKASGGTIKSTVYPGQQLGKAFDHYDMTRDGIADLSYINPGQIPAASRSSPPANCRSWSAKRTAVTAIDNGTRSTPRPR